MNIVIHWDASFTSAPAGLSKTNLMAGIKDAALDLSSLLADPGTLNINAGFGECGGVALGAGDGAEGGPVGGTGISYANLIAVLTRQMTSPAMLSELAGLPKTAPPPGMATSYVSSAEEKAWGWLAPDDPGTNGQVGFSSAITYCAPATGVAGQYDPYRMALHEITHTLGRIYGTGAFELLDWKAPGVLADPSIGGGYLSWDGGVTNRGNLETAPSDIADFSNTAANDALGLMTPPGIAGTMSARDITEIGLLGFHLNHPRMSFLNRAHWR